MGVPQGGVLSPLLFNLALRGIQETLPEGVKIRQFADDILLYAYFENGNVNDGQALIEEAASLITPYLGRLGFKLSPTKGQFCTFSRTNVEFLIEGINIENETIPNTPTLFYLGVILDSKLTWEPHIRYIEGKASQSLNVLRTLAKVTYGADPGSMLMVYKGFPRALLEWGSILIAGANKTTLRRLDKVQNSALRIAMGCMRTTPIPILLSEAGESPLGLRRSLHLNRNALRLSSWSGNPVGQSY